MNKDLDERLVPKGEYREALNVDIVTSEGSSVGAIQNIDGNSLVTSTGITNPTCVGYALDTENDKIIWFVSGSTYSSSDKSSGIDAIVEYDPSTNLTTPIITDIYKGRTPSSSIPGAVLKFEDTKYITGINILNGILFWTDNIGEPKKINIDSMKNGCSKQILQTATSAIATGGPSNKFSITASPQDGFGFSNVPFGTGTNDILNPDYLSIKVRKANGTVVVPAFTHVYNGGAWDQIYIPTGSGGADLIAAGDEIIISLTTNKQKFQQHTYYQVEGINKGLVCEKNITVIRPYPLNAPKMELFNTNRAGEVNTSCTTPINTITSGEGFLGYAQNESFWTYKDSNGILKTKPPGTCVTNHPDLIVDEVTSTGGGNDVHIDYITIPKAPYVAGDIIKLQYTHAPPGADEITLEVRLLVRGYWNSLRHETSWAYDSDNNTDGWTPPGATANYNKDTFNCEIVSVSQSFLLPDAIPSSAITWSVSLEQPDALYEDKFPRFAYRWKYVDNEYSAISPFTSVAFLPFDNGQKYEYNSSIGHNPSMVNDVRRIILSEFENEGVDVAEIEVLIKMSDSENVYVIESHKNLDSWANFTTITKENIKFSVPSNQMLRPYDNVPRRALAQEVVGNRIVYANYLQQYNIEQDVKLSLTKSSTEINPLAPNKSVKSVRDYQLGVVYLDKFGRQSPVLTTSTANIKIHQQDSNKRNRLVPAINSLHPSWATHYKYFIKDSFANDYHNLTLDRIYKAENEENVWLSFPSSDINKVQVDDYLVLKKEHGSENSVFRTSNKTVKYKVLAKEPVAPDFIKVRKIHHGTVAGGDGQGTNPRLFGDDDGGYTNGFPLVDASFIHLNASVMFGSVLEDIHESTGQGKYLRISKGNFKSDWYEVESVAQRLGSNNSTQGQSGGNVGFCRNGGVGDRYIVNLMQPFGDDIGFCGTDPQSAIANGISLEWYHEDRKGYKSEFEGRFFIKVTTDKELLNKVLAFNRSISHGTSIIDAGQVNRIISNSTHFDSTGLNLTSAEADVTKTVLDFRPSSSNVFDPPGGASPRGQVFCFDDGYSSEVYKPGGSTTGVKPKQGDGFGGNNSGSGPSNQLQIRIIGIWPMRNTGITNSNWYPPSQDNFYKTYYNFYQKLCSVGTRFMLHKDPSETVYQIIDAKKELVMCVYDTFSSPNVERGIRITLTLDRDVEQDTKDLVAALKAHNVTNMDAGQYSQASSKSADNEISLQIVEDVINEETYFADSPAVFEVEKDRDIDLNLYYETPYTMLIPKVGMKITCADNNFPDTTITAVSNNGMTLTIASNTTGDVLSSNSSNPVVVKIEETNSLVDENGNSRNVSGQYRLDSDIASGTNVVNLVENNIDYFNCISLGNGVESNRIKDDFNAPVMDKGPRVSTVIDNPFEEEHRKSGLIYSGIYNAKSGVNESNQFIAAEKITKDINPSYGSIQKLFTRNTNLLTICEDKVIKILANKDALFNADGNTNLVSTNKVLGQSVPFTGEYGISTNPESFASYDYRVYFADKNRGSILRLSNDGITNIAQHGMSSYFKEKLPSCSRIIGSYDKDKDLYNVTLKNNNPSKDTTLSFTERTKGWTSFKSFIPESGFSLNSVYYTCFNGELWQHSSSELKNNFYTTQYDSSISFVFNDEPSSIKQFKTISYEGTSSRLYSDTVGSETNLQTNEFLTSSDGKGWYVNSIKTNEQDGSVPDFVEKEGKWFNNIKGVDQNNLYNAVIDSEEFSSQGLGFAGIIESQAASLAAVTTTSYVTPACDGYKADLNVKLLANTQFSNGWWWNSKFAFVVVDLGPGVFNGNPDVPDFTNATYYSHTDSQLTMTVLSTNTQLSFDFPNTGIIGNSYAIFVKEKYTETIFTPASTIIIEGPSPLNAYGYVHAVETSPGASDGIIRIQPQGGTESYVDGRISANANMGNPVIDTTLGGSAPNQFYEFTGLTGGTYYYTITDNSVACGSSTTITKSIVVATNPPITITASSNNAAVCHINDPYISVGNNLSKNGSVVTVVGSGGDGTYFFRQGLSGNWSNNGTNTKTYVVATPSTTEFFVRDSTNPYPNGSSVIFDQTDHTTDINTSTVVTDASNSAGDNGSVAVTVTNATGAVQLILQKSATSNFSSTTTIGTVTMTESGGVHTHTFSGLEGQVVNVFSQPPTNHIFYRIYVQDANGCRDNGIPGVSRPTFTFTLSNTFTPGPLRFAKNYWRLYDTTDITTVTANDIVHWSQGSYPTQSSANIWAIPSTSFTIWQDNPNNGGALWSNCWRFINGVNAGVTYNNDIEVAKIYSQGNTIVDAANFQVRTTGFNKINVDGEHTDPAISSPGAIEDDSNGAANITFTNSQTLNGTSADENNYVVVTVPYNFTMPNQSQKILFHIFGYSYVLGGTI